MILALFIFACNPPSVHVDLKDITIQAGVLPDEERENLKRKYQPLLEYLSGETGLAYELKTPDTYQELVEEFGKGEIDLAYFGGVTFVLAHLKHNAQPLARREIDTRFTSYFFVNGKTSFENLSQLKGKTIGFGSKMSNIPGPTTKRFIGSRKERQTLARPTRLLLSVWAARERSLHPTSKY